MNLAAGIKELGSAKGISEELIIDTLKEVLTKAYIKFKGVQEIRVDQDSEKNLMSVYLQKEVAEKVSDPANQISLKDAQKIFPDTEMEVGRVLDILTEPMRDFKEKEIAWVSENILNRINVIAKDIVKHEFMKKKNKIVSGNIIKIDQKGIYVDLVKTIGFLPIQELSPLEHYEQDDMIKAIVTEVVGERGRIQRRREDLNPKSIQVFLSRTSPEMVKELLSVEVPELADGSIEIKRISRDPGYKTKLAVYSDLVDPVSSCIGPHGIRITNVVKELGGEKIDVVRFSEEPREMIRNALTPARVERVIIQDEGSNAAFVVVDPDQLAYAYGKQKKNVILAARLTGWKINIKTESEVEQENIESADVKELKNIFMDESEMFEETPLSELPGMDDAMIALLEENGIDTVEKLWEVDENSKYDQLKGLSQDQVKLIQKIVAESVEIEDEEPQESAEEEEVFSEDEVSCPHCQAVFKLEQVDLNSPKCPVCQEALEIEIEE